MKRFCLELVTKMSRDTSRQRRTINSDKRFSLRLRLMGTATVCRVLARLSQGKELRDLQCPGTPAVQHGAVATTSPPGVPGSEAGHGSSSMLTEKAHGSTHKGTAPGVGRDHQEQPFGDHGSATPQRKIYKLKWN